MLHQISYGLDFSESKNERERKVKNNFTGVTESLKETPDSTIQRTGVYVQDEIALNDKLDVIAGIRYDNFDLNAQSDAAYLANGVGVLEPAGYNESSISPKLSAIYKINPDLSFYGAYARGFKAPNYVDMNLSLIHI